MAHLGIGKRKSHYVWIVLGVVAVLAGGGSPEFIKTMLEADPMPPEDPRPLVQPDADIIANVAQEIGSDSLFGVLVRCKRAVLRPDDPNYRLADLTQAMAVASAIDGVAGTAAPLWATSTTRDASGAAARASSMART